MADERKGCAGRGRYHPCFNAGSLEHDGRLWCKVHHPPTIAARRVDEDARAAAEREGMALLRAATDRQRRARDLREVSDADLRAECKRRGWVMSAEVARG